MKIVFLEANTLGTDVDLSGFEKLGEVVKYSLTNPEKNHDRILDADVVVLNKIPVDKTLLDGNDKVKLVCLTATGTNNVDFDYCNKRGIPVKNVKGYSTNSVVQHTFAMFFYLYEKLRYYDEFVKSGDYIKADVFSCFDVKFNELYGKTWGIIGLGEIGRSVADIAKAFGCRIQYYSTSGRNVQPEYNPVGFDELLSTSDIVSVHAPLNDNTKGMMNAEAFSEMKKSAIFLNLGRGPIVNEVDLRTALDEKMIAGAGLDVISVEPMREDNPLYGFTDSNRLIITPHIGWATVEARQRCADEVLKNIIEENII